MSVEPTSHAAAELAREEIAIVGMSGRFPGAADLDEFWQNLRGGVQSMRELSAEELRAAGVDDAEPVDPYYVPMISCLDEADGFDAWFFGYGKREAEIMDPQHRVLLESAWAALESAGYDPEAYDGAIGVFGGVAPNTYLQHVLSTRPDVLEQTGRYPLLVGSEREYAVTRIAFKLNLRGPAISVNTACSTSGVALHLSCQSVLGGECDMALVAVARVKAPLGEGYLYEEDGILSPDGRCRPFDAMARGTIVASGAATLVIKRLSDAVRDGDMVHALVRGTAVNNDGSAKTGFTAPGAAGQAAVIAEALAMAEVEASSIGYVEAHGTGTFIGDPIEISALNQAFGAELEPASCTLGAVKSNIGHLDAAAGLAGVIKTVLAMQHGEIPPTPNFETTSPQIDLSSGPFRISGEPTEWTRGTTPRRAGVSSFGLGGTNSHVVLEEAGQAATAPSTRTHQLLTISARSEGALEAASSRLARHLATTQADLADIAHTLRVGRRAFAHRRTVVTASCDQAAEALSAGTAHAGEGSSAVAFMFPGGGAQHPGMAAELYRTEAVFRQAFDRCADVAMREHDLDLRAALYGPQPLAGDALERPSIALPTLFAVEFALAELWMSLGVRPTALIGHSLGEYTAACVAGVFSLGDAIGLVALRGRLFDAMPPGCMLSVPLAEADVRELLSADLSIAAINRAELCVLSGTSDAIEHARAALEGRGIESRPLRISVAAHSHLVEPILDEFQAFVGGIELSEPAIPFVSNLTGDWVGEGRATDAEYWVRHLRETVRFVDGLTTLAEVGHGTFIEVGPGQTLAGYLAQHPSRTNEHEVIASLPHVADSTPDDAAFLSAVARMWRSGGDVALAALSADEQRRRVPLPTYPFERSRFWIEAALADAVTAAVAAPAPVSTAASAAGAATRHERLLSELKTIFHELSGFDEKALAPQATFLELGFDSLFMTQASGAIAREFGIRVSFRQLFEVAPTLDALAAHLDASLAPDGLAQSTDGAVATPAAGSQPGHARDVEAVDVPAVDEPSPTGPWKPLNRADEGLNETQSAQLAALIERLSRRSPGSKEFAQTHRARLADPRTVAGFRRPWKELVYPVVGARSAGSKIWDVDGNEYLDIAMGFGVTLFGHSPPFVVDAVNEQMRHGFEIGPQTPLAGDVAELITELTGNERVAFCNTGSEAVLAAVRLARTVSSRSKIVTFSNDYHGLFDEVLARGVTVRGERRSVPIAPGIPPSASSELVVLDYDDPESLEYLQSIATDVAAVLVEPVQSRHPDLQPVEFLRELRAVTEAHDVALIFDEMITGFRSHPGGVQELFGIRADLVTYGKVIGGGFPIGVVSGCHEYMDALDGGHWRYGDDSIPEADVTWFAGTFVRHPIALAAARASLLHLRDAGPTLQRELNERTTRLVGELSESMAEAGAPISIEHFSSLFLTKFHAAHEFSSLFYFYLRDHGIHVIEGRSAFLSTAHSDDDLDRLSAAYSGAVSDMQAAGFLPRATSHAIASSPELVALSGGQQEIWLATKVSDGANCSYNLLNTVQFTGLLEPELLERSLNELVDRHSSLRTTFPADGLHQTVAPALALELPIVELEGLAAREREIELVALREREATTPFDLEAGPLVRASLIRLGPEQHMLLLTVHHIVCDGWSSGLLVDELGLLYAAARRGEPPELAEPMQFHEYAAWQEERRGGEEWQAAVRYWQAQTTSAYPISDVPAEGLRPPLKTYAADREVARIDNELLEQLRDVAAEQGQTLFTLVLAAFECYLHRLSGQPEIALGVSIAGQTQFPGRPLAGHCINILPLRRAVDSDATFADHLVTARGALLDAFEHQNYSYGSIVRDTTMGRDASRTPLVSVVFNMDATQRSLDFGDLDAVSGSDPRRFENFDVFVNLAGSDEGLRVEWTYNTDLFSPESVCMRLEGFLALLRGLTGGVSERVGALGLLSDRESELLEQWNATGVEREPGLTLVDLFERQVASSPDAVALVFRGIELSYAELNERANRLARWLAHAGVGPEVLVGVLMDRSIEMVVALYAVLKSGGAYVPLDPDLPAKRLAFMAGEAGLNVVLTHEEHAELVPASVQHTLRVDSEWGQVAALPSDDVGLVADEDCAAYVIYTSGSTGRPKGVVITHRAIVNRLHGLPSEYGLDGSDCVLQKTTFTFDASVLEFFWPLQVGARLVVAEPGGHRDSAYLIRVINEQSVSTVDFVPSVLRLFLDDARADTCTRLRRVTCGGEALTHDLQQRFFEVFPDGVELHNLYGPTEAAVEVTVWRCNPSDRSGVVPIGRPLANTQLHVLDERLGRVPIGVGGELHIGGAQVARGYLERPDLTAQRFIPDPFSAGRLYKTGDLARWRTDGSLEFLGRNDQQVKIRGNRVELGEIEAVLLQHPRVRNTAVTTQSGDNGDQRLVAYVSTAAGEEFDEADVREFLKARLPVYMLPNVFVSHERFELTTSGKIDHAALPAPDPHARSARLEYVAPRTPIEQTISDIWANVLGRERVGVADDFFELGGHSLDAMRANAALYEEFGVEFSLGAMFEHPTVAELTLLVTELLGGERFDDAELLALIGELADAGGGDSA